MNKLLPELLWFMNIDLQVKLRRMLCFALVLLVTVPLAPGWCTATEKGKGDNRPVGDKWALVVGISEFRNDTVPKLKYAAKDARDFRNFLVNEANFAPDHVRLLVNDQATERRILSELGTKFLARVAQPDDLVVLFFSTHGSPSEADIRGKNFVVAYDTDPNDLFTTGIEMSKVVEAIKSRILSNRLVLVMDACHSGAVNPGAKGLSRVGNFNAEAIMQGSGQLVICSSKPEQQSWESKRYDNGIFTRKLIEGLRSGGTNTKLKDAFGFAEQSVAAEAREDYGAHQFPSLKSKWDGNELVLALPASKPRFLPQAVRDILEPDSTQPIRKKPAQKLIEPVARPATRPVAAVNELAEGISNYKKGNFGSAADFLVKACAGPAKKDYKAHYYLGNSLIELKNYKPAVDAYRMCYVLSPVSREGKHSYQLADYYSKAQLRAGASRKPATSIQQAASGDEQQSLSGSVTHIGEGSRNEDLEKRFAQISSSMPRIRTIRRETPSASDVAAWSDHQKAGYLGDARDRVARASEDYQDGVKLMESAKSKAKSMVPQAGGYGETESSFNAQKARSQGYFDRLLVPYQQYLQDLDQILSSENYLLQTCQAAYDRLYSNYGYGGGYGTGYKQNKQTGRTNVNH